MTDRIRPRDAAGVADAIRWAISAKEPLEVLGGGTKRAISGPGQTAYALEMTDCAGIVSYEPEELVLTLLPKTRAREVHTLQALRQALKSSARVRQMQTQ